jgi:DNA (cytosine-5)-methyltransferase 1
MAGFEAVLGVDILPPALTTFANNNKHANVIVGDIRKLSSEALLEAISTVAVDVVTGGVPCQGFSRSNRKRHENDDRNFLFQEFVRVVGVVRPKVVVLENVSGLAQMSSGAFKEAISSAIAGLGYDVYCTILNAADYGVPQKRQRIFFVGVQPGVAWRWPQKIRGSEAAPHFTVGQAILDDLPELNSGQVSDKYQGKPSNELSCLLRGDCQLLTSHEAPSHPQATINRIGRTKPGAPMYNSFKQRIRLDPDKPSPTQICGGIRPQFQFGHPSQPRGLSIRERARLQSFPDDYTFFGGLVQGRVQTGNAVPPLLAKALADQIMQCVKFGKCTSGIVPSEISSPELPLG